MTTPLKLTKKLISLPSYVSDTQNETPVTDFLTDFLTTSLPEMSVERQYLKNSRRCNLILRGKKEPKLFILGHIDTVQPKVGWTTDPLKPVIRDGVLYGLGASDMKGSLAAFLCALLETKQDIQLDNLMLLMYVDEEYDFRGIRRFLDSQEAKIRPSLTLSLDGELPIATGCRGLIEVSFTSKGKSGHAANPANGINAITETVAALQKISQELALFEDDDLGQTTTNIASLQGGVLQDTKDKVWLREGNVLPDTAEVIFEVRPATAQVTAKFVMQKIQTALQQQGLTLSQSVVRHDIAPWPVQYDAPTLALLKQSYAKAGVPFKIADRKLQGYIDAQMIAEKIAAPTFIIGTGGRNKHGADENVPLINLNRATKIYTALLREILT